MRIEQAEPSTVIELWRQVEPRIQQAKTLEEAAQELVTSLHQQFDESVVIARVFVTVSFGSLPAKNKEFVEKLAESAGASGQLNDSTPVLSLVGTHGQEKDWNDRRNSKGHVGIPLISASFVDAIPMISRLLKELGVPMDWVDSHDAQVLIKTIGGKDGLFFVEKAGETTDHQGRKIIAAQDFVSRYRVQSVFGTGGAYSNGQIMVLVVFCRDAFTKTAAEQFLALSSLFRSGTGSFVDSANVFSA